MYNTVSCRTKALFTRRLEPFKEQESHEVKEDENCCCYVRKKVLLTGFAQIAKSKRCPRIAIKLFVFFLCTSGFLHQTWDFLQMYLAYPTMLDISEEYPDSFIAPAITICNRNRLLRQPYCKTYPEKCTWQYTTWETFCNKYKRMCPETKPPDFNFGVPLTESILLKNSSNAVLSAVGPQEDTNIILLCVRSANGSFTYCNQSTFQAIQVPQNMFPYRCLSLFSLLGEQYGKQFNLTLSDGFYITLDMQPEEYFNTIDLVQASVVLHDPRKAVNPMTEGITLTAGKVYQFYATMERRESLPPPYASKCRDYLNEWKKNGGIGPLSKDDCVHQCKIKALVDEYGCVGHSITYPNNYEICKYAAEDVSYEVNRLCASSCQDACEENIFHVTFETASDLQGACDPTDEYCKSRSIVIWVDFDRLKLKKFKQIPRIESIELFGYIGGYLGMWLGISLASTFDLAELIYDIFDCALPKRKRNQKTTTPIEQFRHHTAVKKEKNTVKRRKFSL